MCGEESALIESLEGKRGTPRIRPPFPVEYGYLGQPTTVNNVETFCAVTHIAVQWRRLVGKHRHAASPPAPRSTRCRATASAPACTNTRLAPALAAFWKTAAPRDTQAVQVGGPSGVCLSALEFGRRIAFEDVPTAGAFMVFDRSRDMFEVARNFAHFFAHESCGFCTPCRVGTELVVRAHGQTASAAMAQPQIFRCCSNWTN